MENLKKIFEETFGFAADRISVAPGRVNIIGEVCISICYIHMLYNIICSMYVLYEYVICIWLVQMISVYFICKG